MFVETRHLDKLRGIYVPLASRRQHDLVKISGF